MSPPGGGELDGAADDVREHLQHPLLIAEHSALRATLDLQMESPSPTPAVKAPRAPRRADPVPRVFPLFDEEVPRFEHGEIEQVADHAVQAFPGRRAR